MTGAHDAPAGWRPRTVDAPGGALVVYESDDVDRDLDDAIARNGPTPYGRVLWPSAAACAAALLELAAQLAPRAPLRVLELGCGTGLVSLVAARAGHDVLATDVDTGTLDAVRAAAAALPDARLQTAAFDVRGAAPLPATDVVVAADLLYEEALAAALARRVVAALAAGAHVVVGDPGRLFRARFDTLVREGAGLAGAPAWRAHGDGLVVATLAPPAPPAPTAGAR